MSSPLICSFVLGHLSSPEQQLSIKSTEPVDHTLTTTNTNQEGHPGSSSELQTTVPVETANQWGHLMSDISQPFTAAPPAASSTTSHVSDDIEVGHGYAQMSVATSAPPRPMRVSTPNDQYQSTTTDPAFHEVKATLVDAEVYLAAGHTSFR
mmetsp:Transcript_40000/g.73215  ORF Transcript_40000/g.73215 Transcript_40000/m.73215 type:complete len:152 (+) Transcript_40000:143-598(+)